MNRLIILLPFISLVFIPKIFAQLPPACGGTAPATLCNKACISCNFDGYAGSTQGFPSGPAIDFCGTVENAQWMGFIAGQPEATFTVYPSKCSDGNGLQIALYEDCTQAPLACEKGKEDGGKIPVSIKVSLQPGHNYFLLIDGYAGDQCDFTVGVTPKEAVYEPPLGMVEAIQGKTEGCPGATFTYAVPPVFGAGAYIWDGPPGTLVDSMPVPATIVGGSGNKVQITLGDQSGNICVQAANSCESNPPCASSLFVQVLDDSYRPQLIADSVSHLTCTGEPAKILVDIKPLANYIIRWTADSAGNIVAGANSSQVQVDRIGNYTLDVTNTVTGCTSSKTIRVGEPDIPSAAELTLQPITCYGKNNGVLDIGAVTGGTAPFIYALDEGPYQVAPHFPYLTPGDHHLVIEGIDGCKLDSTVAIAEPAELLVTLDPDTTIHLGQEVSLWKDDQINYPDRRDQLIVSAPLTIDMLCDTCMYQPVTSFRYEVTVLDSNGCKATDDRTIVVERARRVFIPNVFAPDSPLDNAVFRIYCGEDVERIRSFRVYSRWGRSILDQNDLAPNDPAMGWDGRINGEKAGPSVFLYIAEIQFKDGETELFRGDVTLVR